MPCRSILVAGCFACLILAGCGGGAVHIVERTGVEDASRPRQSSPESASAAQPSDQGPQSSSPGITTPPDFPPSYRSRVAVYLAFEYLRDGKGPPEIGELQSAEGPLGGSTSVCVQFPTAGGITRRISIFGTRGVFSFGQASFKRRNLDFWSTCPGEMKPFMELQQIVQKMEACRAKGESRCVVNNEPGRRDILVVR
jgi:hypothetical protein